MTTENSTEDIDVSDLMQQLVNQNNYNKIKKANGENLKIMSKFITKMLKDMRKNDKDAKKIDYSVYRDAFIKLHKIQPWKEIEPEKQEHLIQFIYDNTSNYRITNGIKGAEKRWKK